MYKVCFGKFPLTVTRPRMCAKDGVSLLLFLGSASLAFKDGGNRKSLPEAEALG